MTLTCIRLMYQNAPISTQNIGVEFQPINMQKIHNLFLKGSNKWISKHGSSKKSWHIQSTMFNYVSLCFV